MAKKTKKLTNDELDQLLMLEKYGWGGALSGGLSGAATGMSIGGPWGALAGALLGAGTGYYTEENELADKRVQDQKALAANKQQEMRMNDQGYGNWTPPMMAEGGDITNANQRVNPWYYTIPGALANYPRILADAAIKTYTSPQDSGPERTNSLEWLQQSNYHPVEQTLKGVTTNSVTDPIMNALNWAHDKVNDYFGDGRIPNVNEGVPSNMNLLQMFEQKAEGGPLGGLAGINPDNQRAMYDMMTPMQKAYYLKDQGYNVGKLKESWGDKNFGKMSRVAEKAYFDKINNVAPVPSNTNINYAQEASIFPTSEGNTPGEVPGGIESVYKKLKATGDKGAILNAMGNMTPAEQIKNFGITKELYDRLGVTEKYRRSLAEGVVPRNYSKENVNDAISAVLDGTISPERKQFEKALTEGYDDRARIDLLNLSTGMPQKYNTVQVSNYAPTRGAESDVYYTMANRDKYLPEYVMNNIDNLVKYKNAGFDNESYPTGYLGKRGNPYKALGQVGLDYGHDDEKGLDYVSINDVNDYLGTYGALTKGVPIYDRLYVRKGNDGWEYQIGDKWNKWSGPTKANSRQIKAYDMAANRDDDKIRDEAINLFTDKVKSKFTNYLSSFFGESNEDPQLGMKAEGGQINEYSGQSHQGPTGGIPVDSQGRPSVVSGQKPVALTEEGEVSYKGYIFSDKLKNDKGKTFADEVKGVLSGYKNRLGENYDGHDKLAQNALERELEGVKVNNERARIRKALTDGTFNIAQSQMWSGGDLTKKNMSPGYLDAYGRYHVNTGAPSLFVGATEATKPPLVDNTYNRTNSTLWADSLKGRTPIRATTVPIQFRTKPITAVKSPPDYIPSDVFDLEAAAAVNGLEPTTLRTPSRLTRDSKNYSDDILNQKAARAELDIANANKGINTKPSFAEQANNWMTPSRTNAVISGLGAASNIARGLFEDAEQTDPTAYTINSRVEPRFMRADEAEKEARRQYGNAMNTANNMSPTQAASYQQQLATGVQDKLAGIKERIFNTNQSRLDRAQAQNIGIEESNARTRLGIEEMNSANRSAKDNMLSTGINQIMNTAQQYNRESEAKSNIDTMASIYKNKIEQENKMFEQLMNISNTNNQVEAADFAEKKIEGKTESGTDPVVTGVPTNDNTSVGTTSVSGVGESEQNVNNNATTSVIPNETIDRYKYNEGSNIVDGKHVQYTDSTGNSTIGYGHLITPEEKTSGIYDNGITEEQANDLLNKDIEKHSKEMYSSYPWMNNLSGGIKSALEDMYFNMGANGFGSFKNTLDLIKSGNYSQAADNILKSKYAKQVGKRAIRNADLIRGGI